jgi:hypothetical protein
MAEPYALGSAIKSVADRRGMNLNFATDSKVALDMLTKRRGGTAHAIHKELKRIEDEGSTVNLWWSSDQHRGIAEADKIAKRARKKPEKFPEERAPITGRMLKKEATKASMARWQTEWDQGETGRMTHDIIGTVDTRLRGWNHKVTARSGGTSGGSICLKPQVSECICSAGSQDTAQHIIEECEDDERKEAREGLRRRQEAIGGAFPFRVTRLTKDEEVRNFNKFAEETKMEEETSPRRGR